ncbi:MAG: hypothetical protein HY560_08090 [Gemmatimonadetes bacterium]|nr:hypothetical protein [Gemmatimonadota bacterium]
MALVARWGGAGDRLRVAQTLEVDHFHASIQAVHARKPNGPRLDSTFSLTPAY